MSDGSDRNAGAMLPDPFPARLPSFERVPAGASSAPPSRLPLPQALRPCAELALPDRARFRQRLEQRLQSGVATPLALLFLELDSEDAHGTDAPLDRLFAHRLVHALRGDDVVGHMGRGQFACLLTGVPSRHLLESVVRRVRGALESPVEFGPRRVRVRAHVGIAVCPRDGATASVLLKHADEATFRARAHGAGHAFFDPRLDP